jgi:hypothetical protein
MTNRDVVARRVADRLSADMDPNIARYVDNALDVDPLKRADRFDPSLIALGSLIVNLVSASWRMYADLKQQRAASTKADEPSHNELKTQLRDECVELTLLRSDRQEMILNIVVDETMRAVRRE